MSRGRSGSVRLFVFSVGVATSVSGLAQTSIRFDGLDVDGSGSLSRGEFSQLLGFAGSPERFVDLDTNHDLAVSRAEWMAGSPDERGIPLGFEAAARQAAATGAPKGTAAHSTRHGPDVPQPPTGGDPRNVSAPPLDSARLSGAQDTKRGLSPAPPRPSAVPIPPGAARPPGR
jgi:hypothetical protein